MNTRYYKKGIKNGSQKIFEEFFHHFYKDLCVYAMRFIPYEEDAKGIVQNCFVKIWESRNTIDKVESFSKYLYRSVYNACLDFHSREKRKQKYISHETYLQQQNITFNFEDSIVSEKQERLLLEIEKLPDANKKVCKLRFYKGYNTKEVSKMLGMSTRSVESYVSRSIKQLRVKLCDIDAPSKSMLFIMGSSSIETELNNLHHWISPLTENSNPLLNHINIFLDSADKSNIFSPKEAFVNIAKNTKSFNTLNISNTIKASHSKLPAVFSSIKAQAISTKVILYTTGAVLTTGATHQIISNDLFLFSSGSNTDKIENVKILRPDTAEITKNDTIHIDSSELIEANLQALDPSNTKPSPKQSNKNKKNGENISNTSINKIETKQDTIKERKTFFFEETSIEEIAKQLEEAYGITVILTNSKLPNCKLDGKFNNFTIEQIMDTFSKVFDIDCIKNGNELYLYGSCE